MFDLAGKKALVTGAGQGVGKGIALALARQGAAVAVNDVRRGRAEKVVEELRREGRDASPAVFDVTDFAAVEAARKGIEEAGGSVDILVNNAGIPDGMEVRSFRETSAEEWRRYIDLNAYGVLNCSRVFVDGMCERGWGRIVTISSGAGQVGLHLGVAAYGAGKGAAISFMRHLAVEVAPSGVTANTLALGMIDGGYDAALTDRLVKGIPAQRLGRPQDVAAAVVYLASPEASWMTGQTIGLNGGQITT